MLCGRFLYWDHPVFALYSAGVLLSFRIAAFVRILAVRCLHEFLQLLLKGKIRCRRGNLAHLGRLLSGRDRRRLDRRLNRSGLLFFLLCCLHGKIDLPLFVDGKHLYLHHLPDLEIVVYILDEGICNFRNMNQPALSAGKRNKCAKIHNPCDFSFQYTANFNCHSDQLQLCCVQISSAALRFC